ncbi:PREDICTED: catechol O-methyltransferase domain-containing protein 1 [Nanorana parkeri]|uniref:catechol O-methyltransferase domain-containing protein 1 n=1 Tax=Nanorana parkeri TaxID=125878 RepID=UPI0008543E07|nr:PREDICTED: catechol O-methyltransferase domain-containing protein 1 [Nanorana parkeri]
MPLSAATRDAVAGIAVLGATFAAGVYIGKKYFMYRRKKSQKVFDGQDDPRREYLLRLSLREHPSAKKLRQHLSRITPQDISSDAIQLLANLAKTIKSKKILEMGWSYGYNPLIMALVLPSDGKLVANVRDKEDVSCASEYWNDLLSIGEAGTFDLISINMAHQQNCRKCYEKCLRLLRSGGILAIDGVLCSGAVLRMSPKAERVQGMHQLNEAILRDARIFLSVLPLADGLMLCFKI